MNLKFWESKEDPLDMPVDKVLSEMKDYGVNDPEWAKHIEYLERLEEVRAKKKRTFSVSRDTLFMVGGNVLVAGIIVLVEQKHVWTSKAGDYAKPHQIKPYQEPKSK